MTKADLPGRLERFVSMGLMTPGDVVEMERHFLSTKRQNANVIPGWKIAYKLPLASASELDDRGQLRAEVQHRIAEALGTWEQPLMPT